MEAKNNLFAIREQKGRIRGEFFEMDKIEISNFSQIGTTKINNDDIVKYKYEAINLRKAIMKDGTVYYVLLPIETRFNKVIGLAKKVPKVGEQMECKAILISYATALYEEERRTSVVQKVKKIGNGMYKVKTQHRTYYIKVV